MAAALHVSHTDSALRPLCPQPPVMDLRSGDDRYPTISSSHSRASSAAVQDQPMQGLSSDGSALYKRSSDATKRGPGRSSGEQQPSSTSRSRPPGWALQSMPSVPSQSSEPPRGSVPLARRVVDRYSPEDPQPGSSETPQTAIESSNNTPLTRTGTPQFVRPSQDRSQLPSSPRHPAAAIPSSSAPAPTNAQFSQIMPLAASPNYSPPVASRNRAYPQQPTYITPTDPVNLLNPVYSPPQPAQPQPPPEDVCLECTMRDQEMADVDVTSPGVWERTSDAAFEELKRRELEDEVNGVIISSDPSRPRLRGGRLTEQNLRLWLSINPKEPAARQQTVSKYVKSQRALLREEAHARVQAMQEAKQLDNKVRDAYTQLRSSAYDLGSHAAIADDTGGVRIKPPKSTSPTGHSHNLSQSREITLLENGMIVEHVDVRREEREAKERRRKEERRARKSSRSSAVDVTSIISVGSNGLHTDHGASLKPYSRYSHTSSVRPISILTAPHERPDLPRFYSQASLSDVHSLGSDSPKKRFFGFRNLSAGWRSQDSLAASAMTGGSLLDMHVALQRENHKASRYGPGSPIDLNSPRRSQIWPPAASLDASASTPGKSKSETGKKPKALTKLWRKMTGQKNDDTFNLDDQHTRDKSEDDTPLAPPPPLSYLVNRRSSDMALTGARQNSSPSIATGPKFGYASSGMSPPTAPSSSLPSPVSSRPPGPGLDAIDIRGASNGQFDDAEDIFEDGLARVPENAKGIQSTLSVSDLRQPGICSTSPSSNQAQVVVPIHREKSLPPIPPNEEPATSLPGDRSRTVFTYDHRLLPSGTGAAHEFQPPIIRSVDARRQSFGGLSSKPDLSSQPIYANGNTISFDSRKSFVPRYDEFGSSRASLGRIDNIREALPSSPHSSQPLSKDTKRKSKFGLSNLLGKKNNKSQDLSSEKSAYLFPTMPDGSQDEWCVNNAMFNSRSGSLSTAVPGQYNSRISVVSRRALEELVSQDSEFVAYRYPSHDQRLDLFR